MHASFTTSAVSKELIALVPYSDLSLQGKTRTILDLEENDFATKKVGKKKVGKKGCRIENLSGRI